ncbi:twin-arginine translocation signal domain-containing protein [Haladaptatus sp. DJG-WS-42]|uniref:twin-arginine translocation signal domain-containing protein n=1 Tax=Haladaptatus sp. DJG-WS-42 TaxID=3120516 RepID=UPI0030D0A626
MNRRKFLVAVAAGGVAGVAGCVSSTNPGTGGENTTDDPTTEQSPTLTNTSFTVLSKDCGSEVSEASVSHQPDQSQVQVSGIIFGPSACYTGTLESATYDGESDTLSVHVVTEQPDEDAMCAQCIQEIQYEASIGFENGLPETVVVTHTTNGEAHEVARASQSA